MEIKSDERTELYRRSSSSPSLLSRIGWWIFLFIILLTVGCIRGRLLNFPLERDEGGFAYTAQLMLEGVPPFKESYDLELPGVYAIYAVFMASFGQSAFGIHFGLLVVSMASALLTFFIGRRIGGDGMGAIAAGTQALLEMNPSFLGLAAHVGHFVAIPALAGILMLMVPWEEVKLWRCFVAGIFFGCAVIIKLPGIVFGTFAVTWLAWRGLVQDHEQSSVRGGGIRSLGRVSQQVVSLMVGGILPPLVMAAMLAWCGVLQKCWYWTIEYAFQHVTLATASMGWFNLSYTWERLWTAASGLWLLAICGIVLLWFEPKLRKWRFFLCMLLLFSFLGTCPGFFFREHYFLMMLPAVGLLSGAGWSAVAGVAGHFLCFVARESGEGDEWMLGFVRKSSFDTCLKGIFVGLFVLAGMASLWVSCGVFFYLSPEQACRYIYGSNPFPEALVIAHYIDAHSPSSSRIAVLGSEPEIYFYSHRRAATGFLYTYALVEPQPLASSMQRDMIREIEASAPEYMIDVRISSSWLTRSNSDRTIFTWASDYEKRYMQLDGLVEIFSDDTKYYWNLAGDKISPPPGCFFVAVYKKNPE